MSSEFRDNLNNALRYWEFRRIFYNLVLAVVVVIDLCVRWRFAWQIASFNVALGLFILALLANVAYCAAYLVDLIAQWSGFRQEWRQYRWVLFGIGLVFAAMLTHFFARIVFEIASAILD
jgi:hypothetical protein